VSPRNDGRRKTAPPARRRPRGGRGGRTAVVVLGAIVLLVVGVLAGVGAVIFGLIPGFKVGPVAVGQLGDSTAAADSAARDSAMTAPPIALPDSVPTAPAPIPAESVAALAAAGIVTPADSAAGEVVYRGAGRCLSCHGATGEGVAQLGPSLRDERWITGDGSPEGIARAVRDGISPPKEFSIAMPAYARQLPEEAITRVAAYVYALSHAGAVQRDSLAPRPDSARVPQPTVPPPAPLPVGPR